MKQTKLIMGMPITVEVVAESVGADIAAVFGYFQQVNKRYSTYRADSEISKINQGLDEQEWSSEMRWVFELCESTKRASRGYFDIAHDGRLDPSGLVKGWAIQNAANILLLRGKTDFYIEAGGDIQARGRSVRGDSWRVGIRNPFQTDEIVKVVQLDDHAIATSGAYIRGDHIYNPLNIQPVRGTASLSVIAATIYDADRFATAAYAMGPDGLAFIESMEGLEGYMIDSSGTASYTSGFEEYIA